MMKIFFENNKYNIPKTMTIWLASVATANKVVINDVIGDIMLTEEDKLFYQKDL